MPTRECTNPHYSHKYGVSKGRYPIKQIRDLVRQYGSSSDPTRIDLDGDLVCVTSERLRTFASKGVQCVRCGITGDHYIKEKSHISDLFFHLNLYSTHRNGNFILMTKDHIIPKSAGGSNSLSNLQPMCAPCNRKKGDSYGHGSEGKDEKEGHSCSDETSGLPKGVH